jgi:ubiquitin-protein ligase E3 C
LELYTFVLKVMDDEEFIKGADDTASQRSWTRQSALKLSQVRDLTTFLKNLAFSMYWYSSQILESEQPAVPQSLASYFGNPSTEAALGSDLDSATKPEEMAIGSIAGLNLNYLKGTVTGLLRMIYERE